MADIGCLGKKWHPAGFSVFSGGVFIFLAVFTLAASASHHRNKPHLRPLRSRLQHRQSLASVRRIGREDWSQWTANDQRDRHLLLPCLRSINGTTHERWRHLDGRQKHWAKGWQGGDRCDQLRDDGEEIVRSRWPIDTDRRQSELPWLEGRWLWRVDDLGSGHECDPSVVKFFKGSLKMRHLLLQQRILQAIPICKLIGGGLAFSKGWLNNQSSHL